MNYVDYVKYYGFNSENLGDKFLKIQTKADMESFISDVEHFKNSGIIKSYALHTKINKPEDIELKMNKTEINEYLNKRDVLKHLVTSTNPFSASDCEYIKFSTRFNVHSYPYNTCSNRACLLNEKISLFYIDETPVVIDLSSDNIMKVNKEIAFVMEGLIIGEEVDRISNNFVKEFNVEFSEARNVVTSYITKLIQKDYLCF